MSRLKQMAAYILTIAMFCGICSPAFAVESQAVQDSNSITIWFGKQSRSHQVGVETDDVKAFFASNDLDYDYYKDWLYSVQTDELESVTFTVSPANAAAALATSYPSRIVYADQNYHHTAKTNQFTINALMKNVVSEAITLVIGKYSNTIASLASVFGITDPDTYFGSDRVRQGKEYYVNDGSNRIVTKFVELYAPVLGTTKWYVWGLAEGDYVRYGIQLYYKGLEVGTKKNIYKQYYTEHYYNEAALIEQVIQAYRSGREYYETADQYSADIFGYELYNRTITKEMYLEYDDMVG